MSTPSAESGADLTERLAELLRLKAAQVAARWAPGPGQQALLLLHAQEPESAAYNVAFAVRLVAPVDVAALRRSFQFLIRRHPSLRSRFVVEEGRLVQEVLGDAELHFEQRDVSGWPDEAVDQAIRQAHQQPFDLQRAGAFRVVLFSRGPADHVLLASSHHVVCDGWSLWVLVDELRSAYPAFAAGGKPKLLPLVFRYDDFLALQRDLLEGPEGIRQEAYWRERLGRPLPVLDLPADRPRPARPRAAGGTHTFRLGRERAERVRELARSERATPFMVLLAAFQSLLHRFTEQDEVLVGTPVSGRDRAELARVVGHLVNTVTLCGDLSGRPSFRTVLARTRADVLGALAHQDLPFSKVVELVKPERDPSRSPIYQAIFAYQKPQPQLGLPDPVAEGTSVDWGSGLVAQPYDLAQQEGQVDVYLEVFEGRDEMLCHFRYAAALFEAARIAGMASAFTCLLDAALADPDERVARLRLVSEEEARALVEAARGEAVPDLGTIPGDFRVHARRTPDAIAVSAGDQGLSYAELDARSDRVAAWLVSRGLCADAAVGVAVARSIDTIVALLGILKAGGAYVPLGDDEPASRLAAIVADARLRFVIVDERARERLAGLGPRLATVEDAQAESRPWAAPSLGPDNLAFILFTSGSSGAPKGVEVPHRGAVRLARRLDFDGIAKDDAFLQLAPLAFDLSTFEIWGPLLNGGRLEMAPPGPLSPREIAEVLRRGAVTALWLTSGLFDAVVREEPTAFAGLRALLVGGDVVPVESARAVLARHPRLHLVNGYGPTENSTFTTCHPIRASDVERASIPIGRAIPGSQAYVLDEALVPVPPGVVGELYAGGPGVARGYAARPGLTAAAFVPDPFSSEPGARLYRTGDRARLHLDGTTLDFLGRRDGQAKIRGNRVETGEVEAALARHPAVGQCVVVTRADARGQKSLVAYVTGDPARHAPSELRAFLGTLLPAYLVPSTFVSLARLPLGRSGKVDRAALPAPEASRMPRVEGLVSLRTPTEEIVAEAWRDVLELRAVGTDDDFFDLGGHSLVATQVLGRLEKSLGLNIPLRTLFEAPRLRDLAARLDALRAPGASVGEPPLVPVDRALAIPLSFAQERLWFLHQLLPESAAYGITAALRIEGALDVAALAAAATDLVARHETLRTTLADAAGRPGQVVHPACPVALEVERVAGVEAVLRDESRRPFDLGRGPLFRARLLALPGDVHALVISVHHAVVDGWSLSVLLRDLEALYAAHAGGTSADLPRLAVQYADFAHWERRRVAALQTDIAHWKKRLGGVPALDLPTDRPRPPVETHAGARRAVAIDAALAARLEALARSEGATLFMVLAAAFEALLGRTAEQERFALGTPVAGRPRPELEPLVGMFVGVLPLRADLSGQPTFRELVRRVREDALDAFAHASVPFEQIVEALAPERDRSRSPIFQAMIVLQSTPPRRPALQGLAVTEIPGEVTASKYELTLDLTRTVAGLVGELEFNTDLFDPATIDGLSQRLALILTQAVADPDRRVADLDLAGPAERSLLARWNSTDRGRPQGTVHGRFQARAAANRERPALLHAGVTITAGELDARADALAAQLSDLGLQPEDRVALCLPRSPEAIVGMLATLKAGGAFVPLDPAHPRARLEELLADARPRVLLTSSSLGANRPRFDGPTIDLDRLPPPDGRRPPVSRPGAGAPSAAYCLYTSGSTGRPKGVVGLHAGLLNRIDWMAREYPFRVGEVCVQKTSLGFVDSLWETFGPLLLGVPLVIVPDEEVQTVEGLVEALAAHGVSRLVAVPSLLVAMASVLSATRRTLPDLGLIVSSGEALPRPLAAELARVCPEARLINLYGCSEAAADSTFLEVAAGEDPVGIGRPIDGTRIHVLDRQLRPAPVGVPGEIFIAGEGLARGYHGRPGLTAERFVPDPFGQPGDRLYRSGDRGRWRGDGTLEYLGRRDHQVKIRGQRVELGEIESALRERPEVAEAVVTAREERAGDPRLLAFVVAAPGLGPLDPDLLAAHLAARLPPAMRPSAVLVLPAVPRTPSGKVDRVALAALAPIERARAMPGPATAVEDLVAEVWRSLLAVEHLSPDDDFFALGGHSLLAVELAARLREATGIEIPVRVLFEAPRLSAFSARVVALRAGTNGAPELRRLEDGAPRRLSVAQARLWFLERLRPGIPFLNLSLAVRLSGPLDASALASAWGQLLARHEMLRVHIPSTDGVPAPRLGAGAALEVIDVAGDELAGRVAAQGARSFDLENGPLARATVLRVAAAEHVLCLSLHHAIADGASLLILLRELDALYAGAAALPLLPYGYADYVEWQRRGLEGAEARAAVEAWRERLEGLPVLDLPTDRDRAALPNGIAGVVDLTLAPDVRARLRAVGREVGASETMALLAAWALLVSRVSGQDDFALGVPVSGRNRPELAGIVGLFANILPVRVDLSGRPHFRELVRRVREATLFAYAHAEIPFELLIDALHPSRDGSRHPLVQSIFGVQDVPRRTDRFLGLPAALVPAGCEVTRVDLEVQLLRSEDGLRGQVRYPVELFDRATVEGLLRAFDALLRQALAEPTRPLTELSLASDGTARSRVAAAPAAASGSPVHATVHALFAAQAARTPDAVAVQHGDTRLTYGELDRRSHQLARHLRQRGVGLEVVVGLLLPRSADLLVAWLGILKSGAACLPLDPAHPAARAERVLAGAAAALVVTSSALASRVSLPTVLVDGDDLAATSETAFPVSAVGPEHLAYVIATSGSEGAPKLVMVAHGGAVNVARALAQGLEVTPESRVLQALSPAFDASLQEMLMALAAGARLVVPAPEESLPGPPLAAFLKAHAITHASVVPSVLSALDPEEIGTPMVCLGGEQASRELVARWRRGRRLFNAYGPTETTVTATLGEWTEASSHRSIGVPVAGVHVLVLDDQLRELPPGLVGEVYIGGAGVARGYLGAPAATAERFLPDPYAPTPGARMHRTGDVGRRRHDGTIELLGRRDGQVKIRGLRIEPAEIEAVLLRHPAVRECAVAAREGTAGTKRLVAYLTVSPGTPPGTAELAAFTRAALPDPMVPAAYVVLGALPRLANGKVDRRSLPEPVLTRPDLGAPYQPPDGDVERELAAIWCELLGVSRVGAEDGFFDLGGHSLLLVALQAKIRERLGRDLPLVDLLAFPSVRALSGRLAAVDAPAPLARDVSRRQEDVLSLRDRRRRARGSTEDGSAA